MIEIFPTSEALTGAVARHIVDCAAEAIAARGRFVIALSGGSTPKAAYSRLATEDWRLIHILWGDERCVSPDDPRSNYRMAKEALLDRVPIPPDHIHRIRGEDDPERAAAEYEGELRRLLSEPSPDPERSEGSSRLCLVLLGLGDDGHTASLFPGQSAVRETARWVVAVPASSRSPDAIPRVTLTPVILNRARNITFVVSGANKAQTLQRVLEGPFNPDVLPAQAIRPREGRLTWMVDEAAAGSLRLHRAST
jgi:6-phosphogluconolactonase